MRIKICGINDSESLFRCAELNPDYLGFIFYQGSRRYCNKIKPEDLKNIPSSILKTGVFVNEKEEVILQIMKKYALQLVQLHGDESPKFCRKINQNYPVIKAFSIQDEKSFSRVPEYEGTCNYILFDSAGKNYGGNGITFKPSLLNYYKGNLPFFLSGGIGINFEISEYPKMPYSLDINSKFELEPGIKNVKLIETFFKKIKQ